MNNEKTSAKQRQQAFKQRMLEKGLKRKEVWIPDSEHALLQLTIAVKNICDLNEKKACVTGNDMQ